MAPDGFSASAGTSRADGASIAGYLRNHLVFLDGGTGSLLQARGLAAGESSESWNILRPDVVADIHRAYFDAGSNVVATNTFGVNALKYSEEEIDRLVGAAVANVRAAQAATTGTQPTWVAFDMGPTGRMLAPFGDLDFEDAVAAFAPGVKAAAKHGADLIFIETMNDIYETKAALLAARENCDLPIFLSNAYEQHGRLLSGTQPAGVAALANGMGVSAAGVNCSFGPETLGGIAREYAAWAEAPIIFKPNAGLPVVVDGKTEYAMGADEFGLLVAETVASVPGIRAVGGCCGTTPAHIAALVRECERRGLADCRTERAAAEPRPLLASSYSRIVRVDGSPAPVIGPCIDVSDAEAVAAAAAELAQGAINCILDGAADQQDEEADIIEVFVGLPGIGEEAEAALLERAVCELQETVAEPLCLCARSEATLAGAVRRYNGWPLTRIVG